MTDELALIREVVTRGLIWLRPDGWWFAGYGEVQDSEPVPPRFVPLIERSLEADTHLSSIAIMERYIPGSRGADWRWFEEAIEIAQHDHFLPLCWSIENNGYRDDGPGKRVLLGPDGRVWDGHHRIVAMALIDPTRPIPVDYGTDNSPPE